MVVNDTWLAVKKLSMVFIAITVISFFLGAKVSNEFFNGSLAAGFFTIIVAHIVCGKFTIGVWKSYSEGIVIDIDSDICSFPASDVENSFREILTLMSVVNLAKRSSFPISEIRSLNNETKRWTTKFKNSQGKNVSSNHVKWLLNVSGDFGSQQFEFSSKQKRDECRSMLHTAAKQLGNYSRGTSDLNFDL
ncbi:hypothetical protein ABXV18_06420 [Vibrio owensii]|uniref:hypothetical protein n=1 Tax=Vibrio owensii TaxID=696485 RepID=UPI00339141D4